MTTEDEALKKRQAIIVTLNDQANSNRQRREIDSRGDVPDKRDPKKFAVKVKQETFGSKLKKAFFGESVENVGEHMLFNVGIPALKATIADMFSNGLEVLLFGETRGRRRSNDRNSSYASIYRSSDRERDRDRDYRNDSRDNLSYRDIFFDTKREANDFLSEVLDYVKDNDRISISNYISIAIRGTGIRYEPTWEDNHKGWYREDLAGVEPIRTREGWELDIPRPGKV